MKMIAILGGICLMLGCSPSVNGPETRTVHGQVTLDGRPVAAGDIVFEPADGSASSAGRIENGRYSFQSRLGAMQVRITALEAVEGKPGEGTKDLADADPNRPPLVYRSLIPKRYNTETTLIADVAVNGSNKFDFELISK